MYKKNIEAHNNNVLEAEFQESLLHCMAYGGMHSIKRPFHVFRIQVAVKSCDAIWVSIARNTTV